MKRLTFLAIPVAAALAACSHMATTAPAGGGWTTLFDGSSLANWNQVGDANWKIADGAVVADKGSGFLVSKKSYGDFRIRVEFWADSDANSGIFIRCKDPQKLTSADCYEVNIYDKRPDPLYGTGAIVDVSKVNPMPKAGGRWNTYDIEAKGNHLVVTLNGVQTADAQDGKLASGPIGLQFAPGAVKDKGVIKFRKVEIKPL
jgi:hypothetical protein